MSPGTDTSTCCTITAAENPESSETLPLVPELPVSEGRKRRPDVVVEPDDIGWGLAAPEISSSDSLWPTPHQEVLIDAAVSKGARAVAAWEEWKADARIESIDRGAQQILHLAYRNLSTQGVRDPFLASIKPHYGITWARNQQLLHALKETLKHLHTAGIETLVFKGAALIQLYYKDHGVRPMGDVDVLVPEDRFRDAADVLVTHRWKPFYHDPAFFDVRFEHAIGFTNRLGESIDLHAHVLMASCERGADKAFWEASMPMQIDDVATRSLCATDHLLHACAHGALWTPQPGLRWIADALTVLRSTDGGIDWPRVVFSARERGVTSQVVAALEYLRSRFAAPVPIDFVRDLRSQVSRQDEWRHEIWSRNRRGRPLRLLRHHWAMFTRGTRPAGALKRLLEVPDYLRFWAQTTNVLAVPARLIRKAMRVLGRRLGVYQY